MKKTVLKFAAVALVAVGLLGTSCNRPIEWNEQTTKAFTEQCLKQMAKQFKADNPTEFCDCYVSKMKEKEMGMMDMIKEAATLAEACGIDPENI